MSGVSESLVREHEVILKAIDGLERMVGEFESAGRITTPDRLRSLLEFSRVFIDRCHHGKEERCLFPCLERRGIPREGGPIGVMLMEHEMGRELVRRISSSLESYVRSGEGLGEVLGPCREYVDLLRQHIYKENNILFPMGEQVVNEEDRESTLRCYEEKEEEIGHGEHERLERLAEKIYRE